MQSQRRGLVFLSLLLTLSLLFLSASAQVTCTNICAGEGTSTCSCSGNVCSSSDFLSAAGTCDVIETFQTNYQSNSGAGLVAPSTAPSSPPQNPPLSSVIQYNAQSAPWLLTCPLDPTKSPAPADSRLFYTSPFTDSYANIAGDACNANTQPLLTTFDLPVQISMGTGAPPIATVVSPKVGSAANLQLQNLAYSPMLEDSSTSPPTNYISSFFSINSYVYESPPAIAQNDVWTWSAPFVNFGNAYPDTQTVTAYPPSYDLGLCVYNYIYTETTSFTGMRNTEIPFNEVNVINNFDGTQKITYSSFMSPVVPYFTFNYIVPSIDGQSMFQSYDMMGPWSYNTPANSIDQLPIDTPSELFFTYGSSSSASTFLFYTPANILSAQVSKQISQLDTFLGGLLNLKLNLKNTISQADASYTNPYLANVISIAGIPNDYIFVMNYTSTTSSQCADGSSAISGKCYFLNIMRMIPRGYYNTTGFEPSSVKGVSASCNTVGCNPDSPALLSQWNANWNNAQTGYWSSVIEEQNNSVQVVSTITLDSYLNKLPTIEQQLTQGQTQQVCVNEIYSGGSTTPVCQSNTDQNGFVPINMTADSAGDVFITGSMSASVNVGTQKFTYYFPAILEIPNTIGTPGTPLATTGAWSLTSGAPILNEIAVTSTGTWAYAAAQTVGIIYQFGIVTTGQYPGIVFQNPIDMTYQVAGSPGGLQTVLNISYYLRNKGLYGAAFDGSVDPDLTYVPCDKGLQQSGSCPNPNNENVANDFDVQFFHHPVALANINGYIYVLDDWRGLVGQGVQCQISSFFSFIPGDCGKAAGTNFDILVLRVLDPGGNNVPINPTLFNDMFSQQACIMQSPTVPNTCYTAPSIPTIVSCGAPAGSQGTCLTVSTDCTSNGQPGKYFWCTANGGPTKSSTYYGLSTGIYSAGQPYPPYGWVLSANIIASQSGSTNPNPVRFCSDVTTCTYNPATLPPGYNGKFAPIGPGISPDYGGIPGIGFSVNINGTINILFQKMTSTKCVFWIFGCSTSTNPQYNELLNTSFGVENYTKYFDGNIGYACYTDSADFSNYQQYPQSCIYTLAHSTTDFIANVRPPIYYATNPFRYLENLGAPPVLTLIGQGAQAVTPNQGCSSAATNGQPCQNANGGNTIQSGTGAPFLTLEQTSTSWGNSDLITANAMLQTDQLQLSIDGMVVSSGIGAVSYIACYVQQGCSNPLSVGSHMVKVVDTTNNQPTQDKLTITNGVLLTMQNVQVAGTLETITAQVPGTDQVSISVDGSSVASGSGTACYIEGTGSPPSPLPSGCVFGSALAITSSQSPLINNPPHEVTATDQQTQATATDQLTVISSSTPVATQAPQPPGESLQSTVSGYLIIPYAYTYTISQNYAITGVINNNPVTCTKDYPPKCSKASCPALPSALTNPAPQTVTTYSDILVNGKSNSLSAVIEGGSSYLYDNANNGYYIANLTDTNLILPPGILYQVRNDKLFGTVWVNATYCDWTKNPVDCSANNQATLGAIEGIDYNTKTYVQGTSGNPTGGFKTFAPSYIIPSLSGSSLVTSSLAQQATPQPPPIASDQPLLTYEFSNVQTPFDVPLFDFYKEVAYDSPLNLLINAQSYAAGSSGASYSLFGYQQLVYVMSDRFGNRLYVPVEADIANPVNIQLKVNSQVSSGNSNMTTIQISGTAGSTSDYGTVFTPVAQLLNGKQQYVYLYFNKDLNFVSYNPLTNPLESVYCAYSVQRNDPITGQPVTTCVQSNPIYTGPIQESDQNSQVVTYNPSFNSQGTCNPPPQGLLVKQNFECNIYGSPEGADLQALCPQTGALQKYSTMSCSANPPYYSECLTSTAAVQSGNPSQYCTTIAACLSSSEASQFPTDPQSYCSLTCDPGKYQAYVSAAQAPQTTGSEQFCEPTSFTTGNGICTSQLGLATIAPITDNNGDFSASLTACGSGQDQIVAQYYGWPPPEPVKVIQVPLEFSANVINEPASGNVCNPLSYGPYQPGTCAYFVSNEKGSPSTYAQTEFNYQYAPSIPTAATLNLGFFLLSYGNLDVEVLVVTIVTALLILFRKGMGHKKRMRSSRKR